MQTVGLGQFQKLSFSVYGEAAIITVQNYIIVLMIWIYNSKISIVEKLLIIVFWIAYGIFLFDPFKQGTIKDEHWLIISSASTGMSKWQDY